MQPTPVHSYTADSQTQSQEDAEAPVELTAYPAPPQNMGSAPFSVLVGLFEKLQIEKKPERRRKLLDAWFNHWRAEIGCDLYPVLRFILPQKDRERAVYGLKEKNLAKTYIKLMGLGMRDPDSIRLLNWKKPTEKDKSSGDFPTVLFEVVSKRSSVIEGSLSVDDVNDILDELSRAMGKQEVQSKILRRVYNGATPEEQRWIVRVILKDMVISVKETTVFSVFHPDAQDLFNTCSDLKKVVWELWDVSRCLNAEDKEVQLFRSFTPMLCKRPLRRIEDSVKAMGGKTFIIEEKLDGERMQLHKRGGEYFYCSRKGKDYTYLYGKNVSMGTLTPYIDAAFDGRVEEIILDGEMLVWDPVSERNLPFGTLKTAALDKTKKALNPRPCFKVFDLLYLNGMSLLQKSVKFRKRNLRACISEVKGRFEFAIEFDGKTAKDVRDRMDEVMANRGEGLVLKHPDAQYVLNGRNQDWIKVKPEYMDNMGETVDVLVVAGNYGSGKRAGGVSTLICAVLDDITTSDDDEPRYSTFVRIGSGLSFADYVWVRAKPWKPWDPNDPPSFLQTAKKGHEDKGDLYLEPEHSFILKIKAAEITSSDQYHIGFTMRFPRALSIREDLGIGDCMLASAVLESVKTDKKRKMESNTGVAKKKRKAAFKKVTILPEYRGSKSKDIEVTSDLFKDMTFKVSSDPKSRRGEEEKAELIQLIRANGGKAIHVIAKNQPPPILIVYSGTITPYDLKLDIKKGHDVIRPQWIMDCIANEELVPFKKKYFFHASDRRRQAEAYDMDDDDEPVEDSVMNEESTAPQATEDAAVHAAGSGADDVDPELAEWLKIDEEKPESPKSDDSETEQSDPDSDNEDVKGDEVEDTENWIDVEPQDIQTLSGDAEIQMGETDTAMEYDTEHIFMHLCFYLDSPENAKRNGMAVKGKATQSISQSFEALGKLITDNGGRVADLGDPKLTHIVIDKRDDSRRLELMRRTSTPKRRHLVISEYIHACIEEGTLLDEDDFGP